ncbi:enoyl-CoA hydratase-related protein [Paenibacillus elgii]|uniref:enoyl-CoA hydratase-related protein n=1 Tax=Paenibacillus elgii TaxID=189691 RepID=UPI002D7C93CD|nr:enoyl-CoA hydratase-related protein [Paenibacillus elgii]
MTELECITLALENGIAVVTLNRPKALNALNAQTLRELEWVLQEVERNPQARVAIITGAGDKAFAAGADIGEMKGKTPLEARRFAQLGQSVFAGIENLDKPVIAAINGFALGGGCELAMACDIRLASENAVLGQPEINLGLIPGFGGSQRLPRLIGKGMAKELLLTGNSISAIRAAELGLVNDVYPQEELLPKAHKLAAQIMAKSRVAVSLLKKAVNEGMEMDENKAYAFEAELFGLMFAAEDSKEGIHAFLEKRNAEFKDQ